MVLNIDKCDPIIGIYKITNPKGAIYIGQSKNIILRIRRYSYNGCKNQPKIYNSIKKYGWENHIHEIIEECSVEQLNEREIYWGMFYEVLDENGLNCKLGNSKGYVSDETKNKISKGNLGKEKTQQHSLNISKSRKGMIFTQQHKDNMSGSRVRYSILCIENNTIYPSANQASKELNTHPCLIMNVCRGKFKQTKGYTFKFV